MTRFLLLVSVVMLVAGCGSGSGKVPAGQSSSKIALASASGLPIQGVKLTLAYPANVALSSIVLTDSKGTTLNYQIIKVETSDTTPGSLYIVIGDTTSNERDMPATVIVSINMDIKSGTVTAGDFTVSNVEITDNLGNITTGVNYEVGVTIS